MRPASDLRCVFLGRPAEHFHHLTGRGVDGDYLDPALVVPLSLDQHIVEHQAWAVVGIADGEDLDPFILRLRRAGQLLVRLGDHHGDGTATIPTLTVVALGDMLHEVADALEARQ